MNSQPPPVPTVKTSGLAIASLVLGISSFCLGPLTAIPAFICGIVALSKIKKSAGDQTGLGLTIAGFCTAGVGMIVGTGMLAALLLPALAQSRDKARRVACASNMRQIGTACIAYAGDNRLMFPESLDQLRNGYLTEKVLICPSAENSSSPNYQLVAGGKKLTAISEPQNTPLLIESPSNHRSAGGNVLYCDGHVSWVNAPRN